MNQNRSGQYGPQGQLSDSEISLLDIFIFFKQSYKLIMFIGLLGVAGSSIYLLIAPKQYQASAQIQMAQISFANININNNINPLGINIEEPALLIARFSSPTSYTAESTKACGLESEKDAQAILSTFVKLTLPKGVPNIVDIKIIGSSPETATICMHAVFDLIKTSQAQIVKSYIEEAKLKLLDNQERLAKAKALLVMADKTGSVMAAASLSGHEIRFLLEEIIALTNVVASSENRPTRLVAPIYASDYPIAPKRRNVLLAGLFGALFLGFLIASGRQLILSLKAQLENKTFPG